MIGGLDKVGVGRGREWGNCVLRSDCVRWIGFKCGRGLGREGKSVVEFFVESRWC